jgi:hypothetical protein
LAVSCVARRAEALEPPSKVSVLTMGPGDHPFTRFGHNAFLLEWDAGATRRDAVYNFGTFEFDGLQGVQDFMAGRFRYWLSVGNLESTLRVYAAEKRQLTAQELALSEEERAQLFRALSENALPQHRYYDYDYYRDNCSTRVRDALDRVLGGVLGRAVVGPGRLTFRQHTLRLVGDTPWLYFGLDLALGSPTDRPTTRWEELFLPQELHDALGRAFRDVGGRRTPLVRGERTLLSAKRPAAPLEPPTAAPWFAAVGLALGGSFAALGSSARRRPRMRVPFGLTTALLGGLLGALGAALSLFWASKHWAAHANLSLLGCPPWALLLLPLGLDVALRGLRSLPRMRWLLAASLVSTSVLCLLSLAAGSHESLRMALLFLPLWAGWWLAARQLGAARECGASEIASTLGSGAAALGGRGHEADAGSGAKPQRDRH